MKIQHLFPKIANVTDLRYRWTKLSKELSEDGLPILVMEHSTPKAVIVSFSQFKRALQDKKVTTAGNDPLMSWRKKYVHKFKDWDATYIIRKMRDGR